MNKIYRALDEVRMEEEKKKEIQEDLVKMYEMSSDMEASGHSGSSARQGILQPENQKRRRKMSFRFATAAVLGLVVLVGSTSAVAKYVFHYDVNEAFRSYFGLMGQDDRELQEARRLQTPHILVEHNGFAAEITRVMPTEKECYVWMELRAPKEMCPLKYPLGFDLGKMEFFQNEKKVSTSNWTYADLPEKKSSKEKGAWDSVFWDPEKGITYVKMSFGLAEGEGSWYDTTLKLKFQGLLFTDNTIDKKEPTVIDADSIWEFEVPVLAPDEEYYDINDIKNGFFKKDDEK